MQACSTRARSALPKRKISGSFLSFSRLLFINLSSLKFSDSSLSCPLPLLLLLIRFSLISVLSSLLILSSSLLLLSSPSSLLSSFPISLLLLLLLSPLLFQESPLLFSHYALRFASLPCSLRLRREPALQVRGPVLGAVQRLLKAPRGRRAKR